MTWRLVIPALHAVAKAARNLVVQSEELRLALAELDLAEADEKQRYAEALAAKGQDCVECGRRFLPRPGDFSRCCSIGCKFR